MKSKVVKFIFLITFFTFHPLLEAKDQAKEELKTIVIYGDSLSAAYGMQLENGWAHLLSHSLKETHRIFNASISGETSAGGLARMPITLEELNPDLVLLELGANDGLQGLSIKRMHSNLEEIIKLSLAHGAQVALVGISLPASYGPRYIDQFRSTFSDLAKQYDLPFIDFYREDFVAIEGNIQSDGLHPTEKTQPLIRDWVMDFLNTENLLN